MPELLPYNQHTTYATQFAHFHREGLAINPIAGAEPQAISIMRLHAPYEIMSVYWSAVCEGAPPLLPTHRSYFRNLNRVFLGGERYGSVTPTIAGHFWQAAGVYHYCIPIPEGLDSNFALGICPWEMGQNETYLPASLDFYIPGNNFINGILNRGVDQYGNPLNAVPLPFDSIVAPEDALEGAIQGG